MTTITCWHVKMFSSPDIVRADEYMREFIDAFPQDEVRLAQMARGGYLLSRHPIGKENLELVTARHLIQMIENRQCLYKL